VSKHKYMLLQVLLIHSVVTGPYRSGVNFEGVSRIRAFVDRPVEFLELEQNLLPQRLAQQQRVHVLHGLGGMGKTQLAVEFVRRHHHQYNCIFWLDGSSDFSLRRSFVSCVDKLPHKYASKLRASCNVDSENGTEALIQGVKDWLCKVDNSQWLLIFDNVDQDFHSEPKNHDAYDVKRYFPDVCHGFILITTRLMTLQLPGGMTEVGRVDKLQALDMLHIWYTDGDAAAQHQLPDTEANDKLLNLLDGVPLAIRLAGAYLQERGIGVHRYIQIFEKEREDDKESYWQDWKSLRLYSTVSVGIAWLVSYRRVKKIGGYAAGLLRLWSALDNKDFWQGLLSDASKIDVEIKSHLSPWIGCLAHNKTEFLEAMRLLRKYSLIEDTEKTASWATHPVLHKWAYQSNYSCLRTIMTERALLITGWASSGTLEQGDSASVLRHRILPHTMQCSRRILMGLVTNSPYDATDDEWRHRWFDILGGMNRLGLLNVGLNRQDEAERLYLRAFQMWETMGVEFYNTYYPPSSQWHWELSPLSPCKSMLILVNHLEALYNDQRNQDKLEAMYLRALVLLEKSFGPYHGSVHFVVNKLGKLYETQGKLEEATELYRGTIIATKEDLLLRYPPTIDTFNNLADLYKRQGKQFEEVENMYWRAIQGHENSQDLRSTTVTDISVIDTYCNLARLLQAQGMLEKAEDIYTRVLHQYQKRLKPKKVHEHIHALYAMRDLGTLYLIQGKSDMAEKMYSKAIVGARALIVIRRSADTKYGRVLPIEEAIELGGALSLLHQSVQKPSWRLWLGPLIQGCWR
jgi:tetratricopeptide (TPR) repeat protein